MGKGKKKNKKGGKKRNAPAASSQTADSKRKGDGKVSVGSPEWALNDLNTTAGFSYHVATRALVNDLKRQCAEPTSLDFLVSLRKLSKLPLTRPSQLMIEKLVCKAGVKVTDAIVQLVLLPLNDTLRSRAEKEKKEKLEKQQEKQDAKPVAEAKAEASGQTEKKTGSGTAEDLRVEAGGGKPAAPGTSPSSPSPSPSASAASSSSSSSSSSSPASDALVPAGGPVLTALQQEFRPDGMSRVEAQFLPNPDRSFASQGCQVLARLTCQKSSRRFLLKQYPQLPDHCAALVMSRDLQDQLAGLNVLNMWSELPQLMSRLVLSTPGFVDRVRALCERGPARHPMLSLHTLVFLGNACNPIQGLPCLKAVVAAGGVRVACRYLCESVDENELLHSLRLLSNVSECEEMRPAIIEALPSYVPLLACALHRVEHIRNMGSQVLCCYEIAQVEGANVSIDMNKVREEEKKEMQRRGAEMNAGITRQLPRGNMSLAFDDADVDLDDEGGKQALALVHAVAQSGGDSEAKRCVDELAAAAAAAAAGVVCSAPDCGKKEGGGEAVATGEGAGASTRFSQCSRCKMARYCSLACQKAHWKGGHKRECIPLV